MPSVARNTAVLLLAQIVTLVLGSAVVLALPRLLGDVALGRLAFAQSIANILIAVCVLGSDGYIMREIGAGTWRPGELAWTSLWARSGIWLLAAPAAVALLALRGYPAQTVTLAAVLIVVTLLTAWKQAIASTVQGLERMGRKSVAAVANSALMVTVGLPGVILTGDPLFFALALAVGLLADMAINGGFLLRAAHARFHRPTRPELLGLALGSAPFMAMALAQSVYSQVGMVIIGTVAPERAAGWYAAAVRWNTAILMVPVVAAGALMPALARLRMAGTPGVAAAFTRVFELTLLAAAPLSVGLVAIAPTLASPGYRILFPGSVAPLAVLCVAWLVTTVVMLLGTALIALGRERRWSAAMVAMTVAYLALNAALVPLAQRTWGNAGIGAALSTLMGELVMLVIALRQMPAGVLTPAIAGYALRVAVAAAVMYATVHIAGGLPLPVQVGLGAAVYGAASLTLGTVRLAEFRLAFHALRRRARSVEPSGVAA